MPADAIHPARVRATMQAPLLVFAYLVLVVVPSVANPPDGNHPGLRITRAPDSSMASVHKKDFHHAPVVPGVPRAPDSITRAEHRALGHAGSGIPTSQKGPQQATTPTAVPSVVHAPNIDIKRAEHRPLVGAGAGPQAGPNGGIKRAEQRPLLSDRAGPQAGPGLSPKPMSTQVHVTMRNASGTREPQSVPARPALSKPYPQAKRRHMDCITKGISEGQHPCQKWCVEDDDWAAAMGLPSEVEQARAREAALANATVPNCPTANIDVWLITLQRDFWPTSFLLRSLDLFMPCRGDTHIVVEEEDLRKALPWTYTANRPPKYYPFRVPCRLAMVPGYILQAWLMLYADRFMSPTSEYIMWVDTDSLLAMPITCNSLFDPSGRVYQVSWPISSHRQFTDSCDYILGRTCQRSFMATFPFTMPRESMARLRRFITQTVGSKQPRLPGSPAAVTNLDDAFAVYVLAGKQHAAIGRGNFVMGMSQFVWMGEYMRTEEAHRVRQVPCSRFGGGMDKMCLNYCPPGIHLAWGNCLYTGAPRCVTLKWAPKAAERAGAAAAGVEWSSKFGAGYISAAEEIMHHGDCIRRRMANLSMPSTCVHAGLASGPIRPHPDVMIYGSFAFEENGLAAANFDRVMERYKPDPPGLASCHERSLHGRALGETSASSLPPPRSKARS